MAIIGVKSTKASLSELNIATSKTEYWNLNSKELANKTVELGQGVFADSGALCIKTGEFTGRSPKDRFIVKDAKTAETVDWNEINIPFDEAKFDKLYDKITNYISDKDLYVRDAYACSHPDYKLNLRLVSEFPWSNMFAFNMFNRLTEKEVETFEPEWNIVCAPTFMADAEIDGTRQHNFAVVNFTKKRIIIGGTGYTGEIKKGIFSVLNYILPQEKDVLSMHCSANTGKDGDTALFFGLSGTGKTTLSADPNRKLIGDDEHGWNTDKVFNFEGGCYAKVIDLSAEKEPDIYKAIKSGAILENIVFKEGTKEPDFENTSITQNTRVSYPIYHIDNIAEPSIGNTPKNIFFLTYDAFGVLPPISRLNEGQAMYQFISGYTSKVAGTELGVTEPQTAFSACYGAPFLPLHPTKYAEMLGNKIRENKVKVWLVNTGLSGGVYGIGKRMSLPHTRALVTSALEGKLDNVEYETHPIFGMKIPKECPGVPSEVLNPKNTWENKEEYDKTAKKLAKAFHSNFEKFAAEANKELLEAAPVV